MKCSLEQFDANEHDPVCAMLAEVGNWFLYGHLTFGLRCSEPERVNKFHLLIRDTARRFTGTQNLHALGWFLRQEGNDIDKLYHFHFALTNDNIRADAQYVCNVLTRQWRKIAGTQCDIRPWDNSKGNRGLTYITKWPDYQVPDSNYFDGAPCHWKMSDLLKWTISTRDVSGVQ